MMGFFTAKRCCFNHTRNSKKAMNYGMTLKDATSYNTQFNQCKPIFVDTLSFEKYKESQISKSHKQLL